MNKLQELTAARDAAYAAWKANKCPSTESAFKAASRELVSAKKAQEEPVNVDAALESAKEALARREAERAKEEAARNHIRVMREAFSWPRCGEGFPASSRERAANKWAVDNYGSLSKATFALQIFS